MSQELEKYQAPSIEHLWRYATAYVGSALFPDIQSAEQAFVKISAGAELGLQPFQAMNGIDVIQGRPVVKPALLAGMLDSSPEFSYKVAWEGETACTISIFRSGELMGDSRFSMEDAERAGLLKPSRNGKPSNYLVYPRNMLWSRAMSNAVRWYAPGLTMGPVYVPGELGESAPVPDLPPAARTTVVASGEVIVTPYVAPDDPMDDVPFDAAPAASHPAESPPSPAGPVAADEPVATPAGNGGGFIETLADAKRFVAPFNGEQIGVLKRMLELTEPTTKPEIAKVLLAQREGWDPQDILAEMAGWA